jgi:hypothetical protein
MKRAKQGKGNGVFYSSLQKMAKAAGLSDLFEVRKEDAAMVMCKQVIEFVKKEGRNPSNRSKDANERWMAAWLLWNKAAKSGRGKYRFYKSLQQLAEESGLPWLFDTLGDIFKSPEECKQMMEKLKLWVDKNGRNPEINSLDQEERIMAIFLIEVKKRIDNSGEVS